MNRRGFIGVLAALVPASLLPTPKPAPKYEHKVVRSPWINVGPKYGKSITEMIDEEQAYMTKAVDEMSALSPDMGVYMPKTKPFIDDWWRKVNAAMWGKNEPTRIPRVAGSGGACAVSAETETDLRMEGSQFARDPR